MDLEGAGGFSAEQHYGESFTSPYDIEMLYEYLQVYRSRPCREPEMVLMMAVLEDAMRCYVKYVSINTRRGRRLFKETKEWFFSRNDDWVFSFENLCGIFALDAGYIRRGLLQYEQDHAPTVPLPQRRVPQQRRSVELRLAS